MKDRISEHFSIDFGWNNPEWERIRNAPELIVHFEKVGADWVSRCDANLHAAQAKRKQPVEDGYDFHVTEGSRARLHIFPDTPRAIAHEAVNQTILKTMTVGEIRADKGARGPDHEIPRKLARLSNESQARTREGGDEA